MSPKAILGLSALALVGLFLASAFSQKAAAKVSDRPASGVAASVVTDGAMIYAAPDFDAAVIGQLSRGQRVRVSKGTTGKQAKFHKVRFGAKIGFVADIDVSLSTGANSSPTPSRKKIDPREKKKDDKQTRSKSREREKNPERLPIYFSRFVGVLLGQSEFKEGVSGVDASTNFLVYGLKITGPDVLIDGPVLDVNIALHYGAPTYYESLSSIKPTGFVILTDALLMLPFIQADDFMAYIEAGPLLVLSKFSVLNGGRTMDLTSLNFGGALGAGVAYRTGKVALRLEGKYFIERQQYKSIQIAIQSGF